MADLQDEYYWSEISRKWPMTHGLLVEEPKFISDFTHHNFFHYVLVHA